MAPTNLKPAKRVISFGAEVWKENKSEGQSLYILDPDGHKLEIFRLSSLKPTRVFENKAIQSGLVWLFEYNQPLISNTGYLGWQLASDIYI